MKEILLLIVMFWNLENFYDPFDDPGTDDGAYTPAGEKRWTWNKFIRKRDLLAKTILLAGEEYGRYPALIALAETENRFVLNQLTGQTPLARLGYKVIHKDSPDRRGIDVGLLYREEEFRPVKIRFFPLIHADTVLSTRLVLYVKGVYKGMDTLHCFVNHWPSKLGNKKFSAFRRMIASETVKEKTDSILSVSPHANIILAGDFNDGTESAPVKNLSRFVNLSGRFSEGKRSSFPEAAGTYKYKGKWETIDQFLVSPALAPGGRRIRGVFCKNESADIFCNSFLLEPDNEFGGWKIRRTLVGPRFTGGASDHLPIILKIYGYELR